MLINRGNLVPNLLAVKAEADDDKQIESALVSMVSVVCCIRTYFSQKRSYSDISRLSIAGVQCPILFILFLGGFLSFFPVFLTLEAKTASFVSAQCNSIRKDQFNIF